MFMTKHMSWIDNSNEIFSCIFNFRFEFITPPKCLRSLKIRAKNESASNVHARKWYNATLCASSVSVAQNWHVRRKYFLCLWRRIVLLTTVNCTHFSVSSMIMCERRVYVWLNECLWHDGTEQVKHNRQVTQLSEYEKNFTAKCKTVLSFWRVNFASCSIDIPLFEQRTTCLCFKSDSRFGIHVSF